MNTAISTPKEELDDEIDELSNKIKKIKEKKDIENQVSVGGVQRVTTGGNMNVVIVNLPERESEHVRNEMNGILKDCLKLRD